MKKKEFKPVNDAKDLPTTQRMLHLVRDELKFETKALKSEMNAIKSEMKAGFHRTDAKIEQVLSEVARVGIFVEEQNSRNAIVLEGLSGLWDRQKRVEDRVGEVEATVRSIARART